MLVLDDNVKRMSVTKMVKTVTKILKFSPTHFVSNICHQLRCSYRNRWHVMQFYGSQKWCSGHPWPLEKIDLILKKKASNGKFINIYRNKGLELKIGIYEGLMRKHLLLLWQPAHKLLGSRRNKMPLVVFKPAISCNWNCSWVFCHNNSTKSLQGGFPSSSHPQILF